MKLKLAPKIILIAVAVGGLGYLGNKFFDVPTKVEQPIVDTAMVNPQPTPIITPTTLAPVQPPTTVPIEIQDTPVVKIETNTTHAIGMDKLLKSGSK